MHTLVSFRSAAFNTIESKEWFINPENYGDDLADWLIGELRNRGYDTDTPPGQEDFGWYIRFHVNETTHTFVLGYRFDDDDGGMWIGWLERDRGFVASLFGGRRKGIDPEAARFLHSILTSSPSIHDIRWHDEKEFHAGREEKGVPEPT